MEFIVALLPTPVFPSTRMFNDKSNSSFPFAASSSIAVAFAASRLKASLVCLPDARTSRYRTCAAIESSGECPTLLRSLKNFTLICCILSSFFFSSSLSFSSDSLPSDKSVGAKRLGRFGLGADLRDRIEDPKPAGRSTEKSLEPSEDVIVTESPPDLALDAALRSAVNAAESNNSLPSSSSSSSSSSVSTSSSDSTVICPSILWAVSASAPDACANSLIICLAVSDPSKVMPSFSSSVVYSNPSLSISAPAPAAAEAGAAAAGAAGGSSTLPPKSVSSSSSSSCSTSTSPSSLPPTFSASKLSFPTAASSSSSTSSSSSSTRRRRLPHYEVPPFALPLLQPIQ
ncbi:hypothetical protein Scep_009042 [Stephania cephalantha]|uniref:Uncharacterized protein n=1 Tax=Stephania cephalantha TaxID=152367 RepID=A0AAP0PFX7_9MAGN